MRKKYLTILGLLLASREALALTSAVVAGGAATSIAMSLGFDPMPWAIGAAGGTVVYAYKRPATRAEAIANGTVCVFLGGVVAPWAGRLLTVYFGELWANDYILAGLLSATWPWIAPTIWAMAVDKARKFFGIQKKGEEND